MISNREKIQDLSFGWSAHMAFRIHATLAYVDIHNIKVFVSTTLG